MRITSVFTVLFANLNLSCKSENFSRILFTKTKLMVQSWNANIGLM